jgi:hypothetical protein
MHPANPAVGTCQRCGNYVCGVCWSRWRDRSLCVACVERSLEAGEASPVEKRAHLRQAILGLVFGICAWVIAVLAFILMAAGVASAEGGESGIMLLGVGVIILMATPMLSVLGLGQSAAAIRARGDHMLLATAGLILSGVHTGVVVGLFSLSMWQG